MPSGIEQKREFKKLVEHTTEANIEAELKRNARTDKDSGQKEIIIQALRRAIASRAMSGGALRIISDLKTAGTTSQ
ncbi:hypothetical protein EcCFBP13530_16170 [Enterobacter cancerogenus]|uniref:Uncharacterized protein n=1 Tax=Enterobacter cancerogenus TaxID=69218 RepID=A0AB38P2Z4_9ENTR|nr:hypothetical protein [Enterobacter cancerogenus]TKK17870.1 hypothetical protein EcCFBP13530_16170 [Enterobacter cancerogenus]